MATQVSVTEMKQRNDNGLKEGPTADVVASTPVGSEDIEFETIEVPIEEDYAKSLQNSIPEKPQVPAQPRVQTTYTQTIPRQNANGIDREGYWQHAIKNQILWGGFADTAAKMANAEWRDDQDRITTQTLAGGVNGAGAKEMNWHDVRNYQNAWGKLLDRIDKGHFSLGDGSQEAQEVETAMDNIMASFVEQGGDPRMLWAMGGNVGGYKAKTGKLQMDNLTEVRKAEETVKQLQEDLATGRYNATKKQTWDKASEAYAKVAGDSKGAIADAEKVRIQFLYLPEEAQQKFEEAYNNYMSFLTAVQKKANTPEFRDNVAGKIQDTKKYFIDALSSNSSEKWANALMALVSLGQSDLKELPQNLSLQAQEAKEAWQTYVNMLVMQANVDPRTLYGMIKYVHDVAATKYLTAVKTLGGRPENIYELEDEPAWLTDGDKTIRSFSSPTFVKPAPNTVTTGKVSHTKEGGKYTVSPTTAPTTAEQQTTQSQYDDLD